MTVDVEPTITLGLGGGGETLFLCFGSCFLEDFDAALHTWMRAEMVYRARYVSANGVPNPYPGCTSWAVVSNAIRSMDKMLRRIGLMARGIFIFANVLQCVFEELLLVASLHGLNTGTPAQKWGRTA